LNPFFLISHAEHLAFLELSQDRNQLHISKTNRDILQGVHSILRLFPYFRESFFLDQKNWTITFRVPLYTDTVYRLLVSDTGIRILDVDTECLVINVSDDERDPKSFLKDPTFIDLKPPPMTLSWRKLVLASGGDPNNPRYIQLLSALVPITTICGSLYPAGSGSAILGISLTWRGNTEPPSVSFKKSGRLVTFRDIGKRSDVEVLSTVGAANPPIAGHRADQAVVSESKRPKILIIGGTGVIGARVSKILAESDIPHVTTSRSSSYTSFPTVNYHRNLDLESDQDLVNILGEFQAIQVVCFLPSYPVRPEPEDFFDVELLGKYSAVFLFGAMRVARICRIFEIPHLLSVESSYQYEAHDLRKYNRFSTYITAKKIASLVASETRHLNFTPMLFHSALPAVGSEGFDSELRSFTQRVIDLASA